MSGERQCTWNAVPGWHPANETVGLFITHDHSYEGGSRNAIKVKGSWESANNRKKEKALDSDLLIKNTISAQ